MISIIISSQSEEVLATVSENIADTINVPFEIIAIENKKGLIGICEAYNTGAVKATYDIFCFMHEDISIHTYNWGNILINHFKNEAYGLIGIAGGDTKSLVPSSWASFTHPSEVSIVQHFKYQSKPPEKVLRTGYPDDSSTLKPVACIDGVWICTRRSVYEQCKFDSITFPGFHGYDIDYSLQVARAGFKIGVVFDIDIHHYSEGSFKHVWMKNAMQVSEKWKQFLPFSVRDLPKKEFIHNHWTTIRNFLNKLIELDYSIYQLFFYLYKYSFNKYFHLFHFLHFNKEIIKKKIFRKGKLSSV
ncbi:MAG: glycosyltransferase [Chitinophagaceae bacterium]